MALANYAWDDGEIMVPSCLPLYKTTSKLFIALIENYVGEIYLQKRQQGRAQRGSGVWTLLKWIRIMTLFCVLHTQIGTRYHVSKE